ncbi:uncharacterized protein LOC135120780 [Zophobas morio]|uniref:uncharacterized protein LOC135120780 n=1 Tax=Zophobas morio TaxID=2755281 RepID=UPI00308371FB
MDTLICNVKTVRFLLEDLFPQPLEMPRGHRSHVSVDDNSNFFFPRKKFRERNLKKMVNSENDVIGLPQITRQTSLVGECQSESDASISDDFSGDILVDLLKPDGEEMINNIIELIHKRIAKLLKSRTPDILKVPYNQAAELYERVATFVERSTSRGSLSSPVRRELLSLLRLYFEQFHSKRMTQLSSSLGQ